jgi:hypothetical protein
MDGEPVDEGRPALDRGAVKWALKDALDELLGLSDVRMSGRFEGGSLVIKPGKADTQEKAIPIEVFFHKITMVRDRLRVLEQRINSHPKLAAEDRIELQQYITRVYGSLTSFNVLFKDKDEWFIGAKGDRGDS